MRRLSIASMVGSIGMLAIIAGCVSPAPKPGPAAPVAAEEPGIAAPAEPGPPRYEPLPIPEPSEPPPAPPPAPRAAPAAPPAEPAAAPKPGAKLERGTNRPGGDYSNFALDSPDPSACRMACEQEERCRAFTYTAPGVISDQAYCALKESVPPAKPSSCCVSGVK
jgi:hypothetical protein